MTKRPGRPPVSDEDRRSVTVKVTVNAAEMALLDAAREGRPRATAMRAWSLQAASGALVDASKAVVLAPALQESVKAAAERQGLTVGEWVALACMARLPPVD